MSWKQRFPGKLASAEEAVAAIRNGSRIFVGGMCAEPMLLVRALGASGLKDIEIVQFKGGGEVARLAARWGTRLRVKSFFISRHQADHEAASQADYVPLFHSEIPRFFRNRRIPVDVAMVQVSEPDRFGQVSLGVSVDIARSAVESARIVIAQVNPAMPRTLGNTFIPVQRIDYLVEGEEDLLEIGEVELSDEDLAISRFCSELIEDGAIVQVGFAGISQGLIEYIKDRKDLGVHTEMFTDSLIDLVEAGVITNATKQIYRGKSIATFCMGTRRLYDYVDGNPLVEFHTSDFVLHPETISKNHKMVACNIALQVDLRGQIRQGSLGWTLFEGSGGDQDFMRGAALARDGRSLVCLRSTDSSGRSNIVTEFARKASVMMNRGDGQFVITEYGTAYLGGKSIRQRAMALMEIAHPDHRESLLGQAREAGIVYADHHYFRMASPLTQQRVRMDRVFTGGLTAHVRAIKPTDESMLRDLFYHMSEGSVYLRYFTPRRSMPHKNLQEYVNLDEQKGISVVITVGPRENRRMIAEGRFVLSDDDPFPDIALMVDENYHRLGIGTFLLGYLIELAKERGIGGFRADILPTNDPALKLVNRLPYVNRTSFQDGALSCRFSFDEPKDESASVTRA